MRHAAITCLLIPLLGICVWAGAQAASDNAAGPPSQHVWQSKQKDPQAYRDIVDYNIFMPDRSQINARVDRDRRPDDPTPHSDPHPRAEITPDDPDASLVLVGVSQRGRQPHAFIENIKTGEVTRIDAPGVFSQGQIIAFSIDSITYRVGEEDRKILLRQALTGETVDQNAATSSPSTPAASTTQDGPPTTQPVPGQPAFGQVPAEAPAEAVSAEEETLRRMRERRNNE